jgi:hypothetical protein
LSIIFRSFWRHINPYTSPLGRLAVYQSLYLLWVYGVSLLACQELIIVVYEISYGCLSPILRSQSSLSLSVHWNAGLKVKCHCFNYKRRLSHSYPISYHLSHQASNLRLHWLHLRRTFFLWFTTSIYHFLSIISDTQQNAYWIWRVCGFTDSAMAISSWLSSIWTTSGQYAHTPDSQPLFPSDFISQMSWTSLFLSERSNAYWKGSGGWSGSSLRTQSQRSAEINCY